VSNFSRELAADESALLVVLDGYEHLGVQLIAARERRVPICWFRSIMLHAFPDFERMKRGERECLLDLFIRHPYRRLPSAGVARGGADQCTDLVGSVGFGTLRDVRESLFSIAFLLFVNELGVDEQIAANNCGARDRRSACDKVCRTMGVPEMGHAKELKIREVLERGYRRACIDPELRRRLPAFEMPEDLFTLRRLRDDRQRVEESEAEGRSLRDDLVKEVWQRVHATVDMTLAPMLPVGGGQLTAQSKLWELIWRTWGKYQIVGEDGRALLSIGESEQHALAATMARNVALDILESRPPEPRAPRRSRAGRRP
jgi:hypothetical protein